MKIQDFVNKFKAMEGKGARFIGFTYTNAEGETAKRVINIGVSYENMLKKDIALLPSLAHIASPLYSETDWNDAKAELAESLRKSLAGESTPRSEGQHDAYLPIAVGLRWHIGNSELHITGVSHSKEILVAGTYKTVNSKPKTLAKNAIKKSLRSNEYRTFKVTNLSGELKVNGEIIEIS